MSLDSEASAAAAIALCESLLLALNDLQILPETEILGILNDAAAALDAGSGQLDGSDGSAVNRAAAEIIREIIEGGNSVRRRH